MPPPPPPPDQVREELDERIFDDPPPPATPPPPPPDPAREEVEEERREVVDPRVIDPPIRDDTGLERERDDGQVRDDEIARSRRLRKPDDADAPDDAPKAAPRPPGAYPREIAHRERVEYSFDPSNGEYSARRVESSEPVVTGWDETPPSSDQRSVGGWDVRPG